MCTALTCILIILIKVILVLFFSGILSGLMGVGQMESGLYSGKVFLNFISAVPMNS